MRIVNVLKQTEASLRDMVNRWNKGKDNNDYYLPPNPDEENEKEQKQNQLYRPQRLLFSLQEAKYIGSMLGIKWKTNAPRFKLVDFYDGLNEELLKRRKNKNGLSVFRDKEDVLNIGKIVLHNLELNPKYYGEEIAVSAKKQSKEERLVKNIKKVNRNVPLKPSKTILNKKDEEKGKDWRWNDEDLYDEDGINWNRLDKIK